MPKAIIFDFDGVMFDSEPIHWEACNSVLIHVGFTIPYGDYLKRYVGLADAEMFPQILSDYGYNIAPDEIRQLVKQKVKAYEHIIESSNDVKSVPGLAKFIEYVRQDVPALAICSASTRGEINAVISKIENGDLKKYFEVLTTSEEVSAGKPDPEGYLKTAKKINVNPEQCLVIEDTKNGVLAAKNAKMKVVAITTTNKKDVLKDADLVVDSFQELMDKWKEISL